MRDLSVLIPARHEEFLARTIQDLLENIEADTEIIVVLDGEWSTPPIPQNDRVSIIYLPESIGQRASTNLACKLSRAKFVIKIDSHCAFDKGFDRKMIAKMQDNYTMLPVMRNLHAFNWVCSCGFSIYQDKSNICPICKTEMTKDVVWIPKTRPESFSFCFDYEPHFQYFNEYTKRPECSGDLTESMSIQGSCFMCTREKYWELNLSDEAFGSWGSQGIEVACKTWLSGGRVVVNHDTWYAHMFRTKAENNFGFPYPQSGNQIENAKKMARDLFYNGKWEKAIHPLSWLVERFLPISVKTKEGVEIGWTPEALAELKKIESGNTKV